MTPARLDVDQVVVVAFRRLLIAGAAVAEIMALEDAGLLEQTHRAINRGERDVGVDLGGALVHLFDIGMIGRIREHARDHAPLLGHLKALVGAEFFKT